MNRKDLYTKAYRILNRSTPLNMDCGTLCSKACCNGEDEDAGMHLFPGEAVMYGNSRNFLDIRETNIMSTDEKKVLLAVCRGECDRDLRPLACRIFPLTPYITDNDVLIIKVDPRAGHVCPLVRFAGRNQLDQEFVRNVRKVFRLLLEDEGIKRYIVHLSRILDDYVRNSFFKL